MKALLAVTAVLLPLAGASVLEPQSESEKAVKEFKIAYQKAGQNARARAAAVEALGKVPDKRTLAVLAEVLQGSGGQQETAEVRIAAAEAIGSNFQKVQGAWGPPATVARTRDRKITDVRTAAAKAMVDLGQKESLRTMQDLCDDKPFEVAREAVRGMAKIQDRGSVPILIKLLREVERVPEVIAPELPFHGVGVVGGAIVDDARAEQNQRRELLLGPVLDTLKSLTGQSFQNYKDWSKWWGSASSSFKIGGGK